MKRLNLENYIETHTTSLPTAEAGNVRKNPQLSLVTPDRLRKLEQIRTLNFTKRIFRPLETGSLRSVVTIWVRMTMGIGILTIPYYFKQYGAIIGLLLIAICGCINLFIYNIIFEISHVTGKKTFSDLIEDLLGKGVLSVFNILNLLDTANGIMVYLIMSWKLFEYMIYSLRIGTKHWDEWIPDQDAISFNEYHPTIYKIRAIFIYSVFILSIPLFLKQHLRNLKKITFFYLFALFLLLSIIMFEVPYFRIAYEDEYIGFHWFKKPSLGWIECFFGLCTLYYIQTFLFLLRGELLIPSSQRTQKVSLISTVIETCIFMIIGLFGYFALGDEYTPNLFILRKPYPGKNIITEYVFQFAIVLFFIVNTLGLAIFNPSLRDSLNDMITMRNEKLKYILISLGPFFIICTISVIYPSIVEIINFSAFTVINFLGYIIPLAMKIKLSKIQKSNILTTITCYMLIVLFSLLGIIGLILRLTGISQLE